MDLFPAFRDEARLLLDRLDRSLRALIEGYTQEEFEVVFRSVHTLKSSARAMGLEGLGTFLHTIETAWEEARVGQLSGDIRDRVLRVVEILSLSLDQGTLSASSTLQTLEDVWAGRQTTPLSSLSIPPDIHLSPQVYQRLMGASENVLATKMRVEALGGALLRALGRSAKDERTVSTEYQHATAALHRATVDLESSVRDARMTPLSVFFDRIPLLVRDLALSLHKSVEVTVSGGDLQADRLVIGELGGALGHLVRNAIDHGIVASGIVRVFAHQDHDHLLVTVEDDGKGIAYEKLEEVARTRGIINRDAVVSEDMKKELLFHPQVSTASEVTEVSGRGIGMSAVREYVRSVGGSIVVETPFGDHGTRVVLRIPTSLSLIRILLVRAGQLTFGIPMTDIRETVPFTKEMVTELVSPQRVNMKGLSVPFFPLGRMFSPHSGYRAKGAPFLLHLDTDTQGIGVLVDAVLSEEEVLVKSLPKLLAPLTAFRGAAMVGDGRTVFIIDSRGLSRVAVPRDEVAVRDEKKLLPIERDQFMEIMNMIASHAGGALARRFGSHIELSVPECADGDEQLPEEDWGASAIGVKMNLEGEYPGHLLFEIPATLGGRLTEGIRPKTVDLHDLSNEERAFFQEIGQIAMHAVGNMLSKISKHPVMTTMSDVRVDARGALRTYFLSGHQGRREDYIRVRLWFGVGEGIRTDDHRETGSLTMELRREDAKRLLLASGALS